MALKIRQSNGNSIYELNDKNIIQKPKKVGRNLKNIFYEIVLPRDYKKSVSIDYLNFQYWDSLQALSSYLRGILCTHAIFKSIGIGNTEASVYSATILWILKDLVSLLGSLLFAYIYANNFGINVKKWRLFADIINDIALTIELLTPLSNKDYLPYLLSISSLFKALCGIAATSSRSALSVHFAKNKNVSDISVKEGIQEQLVTLIGMVLGYFLTNLFHDQLYSTFIIFILLTIFHVYANYKAMKCLIFKSINFQRGILLIENFLLSQKEDSSSTLLPSNIAIQEKIFYNQPKWLIFGCKFTDLKINNINDFKQLKNESSNQNYIICKKLHKIYVFISNKATNLDLLEALYESIQLYHHIEKQNKKKIFLILLNNLKRMNGNVMKMN